MPTREESATQLAHKTYAESFDDPDFKLPKDVPVLRASAELHPDLEPVPAVPLSDQAKKVCLKQVLQSGFFFKGPEISSALANAPDCGGILAICRVLEGSTPSNYIHVEILLKAWNYVSYDALNLLKSIAPGAPIPTINFFGVVVAADVIRPTSLQQMKEATT